MLAEDVQFEYSPRITEMRKRRKEERERRKEGEMRKEGGGWVGKGRRDGVTEGWKKQNTYFNFSFSCVVLGMDQGLTHANTHSASQPPPAVPPCTVSPCVQAVRHTCNPCILKSALN